jgi:hypothetical protein
MEPMNNQPVPNSQPFWEDEFNPQAFDMPVMKKISGLLKIYLFASTIFLLVCLFIFLYYLSPWLF